MILLLFNIVHAIYPPTADYCLSRPWITAGGALERGEMKAGINEHEVHFLPNFRLSSAMSLQISPDVASRLR